MPVKEKYLKNLEEKNFHKLIIGAALKDFKAIEEYAYYFTCAGADVLDISAFPHSVLCAKQGIKKALEENPGLIEPLIMVSVNIGEDPHFRRIKLDLEACTDCLACVPTCPSQAFMTSNEVLVYNEDLCFGCANCLPSCNFAALEFENWTSFAASSLIELQQLGARAIEVHLNNDLEAFKNFYKTMPEFELESFCIGSQQMTEEDLEKATESIIIAVQGKNLKPFIIQTDGIPLSGAIMEENQEKDLVSMNNAKIVKQFIQKKFPSLEKNIFIQLAGGCTEKTLAKAKQAKIDINGVAIGSYARKILSASQEPVTAAGALIKKSPL